MDARRALHLGLGALTGLEVSDLDRKGERFDPRASASGSPPATPRPSRCPTGPSWTSLLREVGLDVTWDATTTTYRRPDESPLATSGSSRLLTTGSGSSHGSRRPRKAVTPEVAEARQFEERLRYALRDGAFLVLTVRPSEMTPCERAAAAAVPGAGAGLVRPPAAEAPAGQGRRAGGRLAGGARGRRRPAGLGGLREPVRPGRAGRSRPSRPNSVRSKKAGLAGSPGLACPV